MPYVESPLDRIVNVNWGRPLGLSVEFDIDMVGPDEAAPAPPTTMTVVVTGLPPLARTTLVVPYIEGDEVKEIDQVSGVFPGGISGFYFIRMGQTGVRPVTFFVNSSAEYTTVTSQGMKSVSVAITLEPYPGYSGTFLAIATCSIAPPKSLSGTIDSRKTVTATVTLNPPSLSFG